MKVQIHNTLFYLYHKRNHFADILKLIKTGFRVLSETNVFHMKYAQTLPRPVRTNFKQKLPFVIVYDLP